MSVRSAFAQQVRCLLTAACRDSRAGLRASLGRAGSDAYSDIDLHWLVPDHRFADALRILPDVLAAAGPVEALRYDPDLQRSDRRRLVFVSYAHLPLLWRVDLDIRAMSVADDEHYDERNPAARGDDWSLPASALANAVGAIKALKRDRPDLARALLDRAYDRLGIRLLLEDWVGAILALVDRAVALEPAQAPTAHRVIDLTHAELAMSANARSGIDRRRSGGEPNRASSRGTSSYPGEPPKRQAFIGVQAQAASADRPGARADNLILMRLETWHAPPGDRIPNHPRFPVLLYREVDAAVHGADGARALFAEHGWRGSWVDGIFGFHHFHSTSHEALAVVSGHAVVELGGPQGRAFDVGIGDVLVLPAGTGHRRASASDDFVVVGAYPVGQEDYDLLRGEDPEEVAVARRRIEALDAPVDDPVGGDGISRWH